MIRNVVVAFAMVATLLTTVGNAAPAFREDFKPGIGREIRGAGGFVPLEDGGMGWKGTKGGTVETGAAYVRYPFGDVFRKASEGTVTLSVQRGESYFFETLFAVADSNNKRLFSFRIEWENPTAGGVPVLKFYRGGSADLWGTSMQKDRWGPVPVFQSFVPLGFKVQPGEWVNLAMTWDASGRGSLYANGSKLPATLKGPLGLSQLLAKGAYLYIGAEPSDKFTDGAHGMATSTIRGFTVFDKVLSDSEIDFTAPAAPERIIAEPGFGGEIKVSWAASVSNDVAAYEVYRGEGKVPDINGKPYQVISLLELADTGLVPGIAYQYRVIAVDKSGNRSLPSEAVSSAAVAGDGPRISSVAVEPAGKPLRPGDTMKIILTGEPGGKGLVDIQNLQADLVLAEIGGRTGRYEGTLPITEAEVANERQTLQVVGKLSDAYGASRLAGPAITIVSAADLNDKTPPVITELTHDGFAQTGFSGKLVAGDTLTVTLAGEAGGFASFRLVGVTDQQTMAEVKPGVYTGSYTFGFDDVGEKVAVEATLADFAGNSVTAVAAKTVDLDTRVRLVVTAKDTLLPADRASKTRISVRAEDANGDDVEGHELALTLSTTTEYTGVVGGGKVEDKFAAKDDVDDIEVKWSGVTDSFGELAATYTAGFAAKTALILAKDMTTGDMGAGWVNTYVASTVAIELLPRAARDAADLAVMRMSLTPPWLTADGRSKSRVKVWLADLGGAPIAGAVVNFTLGGTNGSIKVLRGVTDEKGLAEAEYRAGTLAGFETITAAAPDYHVTQSMQIELRSDAPAKIDLVASAVSMPADGRTTSNLTAVVSDINDNRNPNVPVMFKVLEGGGAVAPAQANTDLKGVVEATYTAGTAPGIAVVEARHTSRAPTVEELRRIAGTVFVPRLYKGQEGDRIKVTAWLVEEGDEVAKGQPVVEVETSDGKWTIPAAEKGILVRHVRHKRDRVETGETLGYVEIDPVVWEAKYAQ
jgi:biotin carboxyl carrier protein